jgi:hypothetical protein
VNGKNIKEPKIPNRAQAIHRNRKGKLCAIRHKRKRADRCKARKGKKPAQVYKVVGKYKYKKNEIMLRLHDGSIIKEGEARMQCE